MFNKGLNSPQGAKLHVYIEEKKSLSITGVIYQEILQGLKENTRQYKIATNALKNMEILIPQIQDYELAASIYRKARLKGITPRSGTDCLIAAQTIHTNRLLFTLDKDFQRLQKIHPKLSLHK